MAILIYYHFTNQRTWCHNHGVAEVNRSTPASEDPRTRKTHTRRMYSANGARDGKTASWIVERAKCKDAEDFARQLSTVSEATCPADGLKMAPVTPLRMGLQP